MTLASLARLVGRFRSVPAVTRVVLGGGGGSHRDALALNAALLLLGVFDGLPKRRTHRAQRAAQAKVSQSASSGLLLLDRRRVDVAGRCGRPLARCAISRPIFRNNMRTSVMGSSVSSLVCTTSSTWAL